MGYPDHYRHARVTLYRETLEFLHDAITDHLADLRRVDKEAHELGSLFTEPHSTPIRTEIRLFEGIDDRIVEIMADMVCDDVDVPIEHKWVRALKAVALRRLRKLEAKAGDLERRGHVAQSSAVREQLEVFRRKFDREVFADAEPMLLSGEQRDVGSDDSGSPMVSVPGPRAQPLELKIVDDELRTKCCHLLANFQASGATDRFDLVVMEATRILEIRLKAKSGVDKTGLNLVSAALGPGNLRLRLADHAGEIEGAHSLFRGVVGFIRNPTHHRLVGSLDAVRAQQVVGFVDYLLHLIESGTKVEETPGNS